VDLPEFKGKHRKFRNLVSSYLGKCSVQKNSSVMKFSTHLFRTYFFFSKSIKEYFRFRLAFMVSVPRFVAQCTSHVIFFFFVSFAVRWNPNIQLLALCSRSRSCYEYADFDNIPFFFFTSMCQLLIIFYVTLSTSIRFLIFSSLLSFSSLGFFFFFFVLYPRRKVLISIPKRFLSF
jgi:hypothetical protein